MLTTQLAEASAARRCKINCHKIKFGCMPPMTKIINKNEAGSSLGHPKPIDQQAQQMSGPPHLLDVKID